MIPFVFAPLISGSHEHQNFKLWLGGTFGGFTKRLKLMTPARYSLKNFRRRSNSKFGLKYPSLNSGMFMRSFEQHLPLLKTWSAGNTVCIFRHECSNCSAMSRMVKLQRLTLKPGRCHDSDTPKKATQPTRMLRRQKLRDPILPKRSSKRSRYRLPIGLLLDRSEPTMA